MGISIQIVLRPVFEHKVDVTAESIPPEIPITKPFVLEFFE